MDENDVKRSQASVFKRFRQHRQQSTSLSSFQVTDQQHKDRDSLVNQIPNNKSNERSEYTREKKNFH